MALTQPARKLEGFARVAGARGLAGGEQLVGNFGHRADDHDRHLLAPSSYDFRGAVNRRAVLDGGATEFHDDHRRLPRIMPDIEPRMRANRDLWADADFGCLYSSPSRSR